MAGRLDVDEAAKARIRDEAIRTILREPALGPGDAAVALGAPASDTERVRLHRERGWLLGLPGGRGPTYPAFQFDAQRRCVFPEVRAVNEHLGASDDPWGVASWWVSRNDRIEARPVDLVGTERAADLVDIAGAVTEPVG